MCMCFAHVIRTNLRLPQSMMMWSTIVEVMKRWIYMRLCRIDAPCDDAKDDDNTFILMFIAARQRCANRAILPNIILTTGTCWFICPTRPATTCGMRTDHKASTSPATHKHLAISMRCVCCDKRLRSVHHANRPHQVCMLSR